MPDSSIAPMKRKKLLLLLLLPIVGALVVFIGVNVADYCRYRYIMNLDKHLTAADFEALVQAVKSASVKERESMMLSGSDMPAIFQKIGAKKVRILAHRYHLGEISATAVLYERGKPKDWRVHYTCAWLHIDITKENQRISQGETFSGRPEGRTLWIASPALAEQANPRNRILSLTLSYGRGIDHAWIVTQDAIRYSARGGTPVKQPITIFQSDAIRGAIDMIPAQFYGKRFFDARIVDGMQMGIEISRDGSRVSDDIMVDNAWLPELEPLLNMLKEFAPHAEELPTKKMMVREFEGQRFLNEPPLDDPPEKYVGNYQVQSIDEWEAYPPLQTDWWIVWPRLFLEKPKVVLDMSPGLK